MDFATGHLLYDIPLFVAGLFLLLKGSGWFVDSASFIAKKFDVSEMVVGLTLVSVGTSLPELATNVYASFTGEGDIALGNAVGSNLTNVTLVLGLGGLLYGTLSIPDSILKRDLRIMLLVYVVFAGMCWMCPWEGRFLLRWEGLVLLAMFAVYSWWLFRSGKVASDSGGVSEKDCGAIRSLSGAAVFFAVGLAMITCGAKMSVDTVVVTAEGLHVPKEIISATVIAFGTSVPELAVTVTGLRKDKNDLALGNIVGSCIFNLVLVMGTAVTITPIAVSDEMAKVSLPLMLFSGAVLLVLARNKRRLARWESATLLAVYVVFIGYNAWLAVGVA
jgi:cation:H+ antiporter